MPPTSPYAPPLSPTQVGRGGSVVACLRARLQPPAGVCRVRGSTPQPDSVSFAAELIVGEAAEEKHEGIGSDKQVVVGIN